MIDKYRIKKTQRGFAIIRNDEREHFVLVQESSAIGDHEDAMDKPGSSFLWIGNHHHLNREQVLQLVGHLQRWLSTGKL